MRLKHWYYAIRPWRLPAAIVPVFLGSCLAFRYGAGRWTPSIIPMFVAIMIQIGASFVKDIINVQRSSDTSEKLIDEKSLWMAAVFVFVAAGAGSVWIVIKQEAWNLIPFGLACILAGILYPKKSKAATYTVSGSIFVLIIFGPAALAGTYYIQALSLNLSVLLAGFGCGLVCWCYFRWLDNRRQKSFTK